MLDLKSIFTQIDVRVLAFFGQLLTENSFPLLIFLKTVHHVKNIQKKLKWPAFTDFMTITTIGTGLFCVPIMAIL